MSKKIFYSLLLSLGLCIGAYAQPAADGNSGATGARQERPREQRRQNVAGPLEDTNKVVDNTLDSLNIARTARPAAGSSRQGNNPVLFLIGDSTMRNGTLGNGSNGQWGWGYYAGDYFDNTKITVENHALGGLSSRTFYENFWPAVLDGVQAGDWVIIQLGHNDNGPYDSGRARASIPGIGHDTLNVTVKETGVERTVYTYGDYMRKFVNETRAKGAHPVLMSVTMRNSWNNETGKPNRSTTHAVWARQVAQEMNVPFVDLNETTAQKYEQFGRERVKYLFYGDAIHTGAFGAQLNAGLAAQGIRQTSGLKLADYLKPEKAPYDSPKRVGNNPVLFTVGDSTVRNKDNDEEGMWGWGSVIGQYLDSDKITVDNQAMAGRSTRTFMNEGRWERVYEALRPGDFVLIQFGHNDGGAVNTDRARGVLKGNDDDKRVFKMEATGKYEAVYTFGWYLRKFIAEAKEKGAIPIILSHTPRNQFDEAGKIRRNSESYGLWSKEAAEQGGAYFIDLNGLTAAKLDAIGDRDVISSYFKDDHTHSSLKGAKLNAESIIEGLKASDVPLKEFVK